MHILALYDIRDPKRLRKVAKIMENYGIRVQYSAFEMEVSEALLNKIILECRLVIKKTEDYMLFFDICEKDWQNIEKYGNKSVWTDEKDDYKIL